MKKALISLLCLCMLLSVVPPMSMAATEDIYEIYVSTAGDDLASGASDNPLKTLKGARDKIRSLKANGVKPKNGFTVYLRSGDYQITEALELTGSDSGTKTAPVTYSAYPGEEVTLVGGASIPGSAFNAVTDTTVLNRVIDETARGKLMVADLKKLGFTDFGEPYWPGAYSYSMSWLTEPDAASPELFVDGAVQMLARYPNEGFMKVKDVYDVGAIPRNWEPDRVGDPRYVPEHLRDPEDTFEISFDDERYLKWTSLSPRTALMYGYFWYDWADHTVPIEKIENGRIYSSEPSWYGVQAGQRLCVMNLIEEIDIPGEYYLDREKGLLYLYPSKELSSADIKLSILEDDLIHIKGASNVKFKGLKMTAMRSSAVVIDSGENIEIDSCEIEYTADYAVYIKKNPRNCRVINSFIHDVNGGVYMMSGDITTLTAGECEVENNVITRFSRINKTYCPAVQLGGVGNIVEHNEISDAEHCAIQYAGNNHSISYNEIYNVCQQADDMGAIYSGRSWIQRGTKIHYNYLHDIKSDSEELLGLFIIYNDDRLSEQSVVGNLFRNCEGYAYFANGGRDNVFSNNILINQEKGYRFDAIIPPDPIAVNPVNLLNDLNSVPWQNDLWKTTYPKLYTILDVEGEATYPENCSAGNNILVNCGEKYIHTEAAQRGSFGADYEAASVKFNEDYTLDEDSPVYSALPKFKNLPTSMMGTYSGDAPSLPPAVAFYDDFQTETDNTPDNWKLFKETSTGVMTIEEESGNKFLRVNPTANWASGDNVPGAITKPGKVNVPTDRGTVVIKMKIRSKDIVDANTRQNIRLSYDEISTATGKSNEKLLFATRDYGDLSDVFCFANTSDNAVTSSDFKISDNVWYDVTSAIDFENSRVYYIIGNKEGGYKRYSVNITGSALSSLGVVDSVTLLMEQVSPNNYTDIDDVSVDYLPDAKAFYDNFENDDASPENWSVAATSASTTATVKEENGNKYLRLEATALLWSSELPSVVTNDDMVAMPLVDKPVLVRYKTRLATESGSKVQFLTRLSIPGGAASTTEILGNEYQPFTIRTVDGKTNLYYYTTKTYPSACSTISFKKDTWYDISALIDPVASTITYTVKSEDGKVEFSGAGMEKMGLASLDVIDNLSTMIYYANSGAYMDIDDVYIGYPEDYESYLPNVTSFEDTFEDVTAGSVPVNWTDNAGVSTLKVESENGNRFVRVTKNAGTTGVPQVSTKEGVINIEWKDNTEGIVVEAKIRQQNQNYRSLLMINAPDNVTDSHISSSNYTPFFIHTNVQAYFMPGFLSGSTFATLGEWFRYKAIILPGEEQTEIRHYFNDRYITSTYTSLNAMPEIFNPETLYKLSFVWRPASGNASAATSEGYMDFDDIRIYPREEAIYNVEAKKASGGVLSKLENGTVNISACVINNAEAKTLDVFGALYTRKGNGWELTAIKAIKDPYLSVKEWGRATGTLSLDVTDAENQMLKVFVFDKTNGLLSPVCDDYVLN